MTYEKAVKVAEAANFTLTPAGAKIFELYGNLLSNKARQQWEYFLTPTLWKDVYEVVRTKSPTMTWNSFCEGITFHLQQVFLYDTGKTRHVE